MRESNSTELVKQRDDLIAKIACEREGLSQNGTSMRPLVKWASRVNGVLRYLGDHPEFLILPAAIMTVSRPRRLLAMAISGLGVWRLIQKLRH